jgi:hypothetical protein
VSARIDPDAGGAQTGIAAGLPAAALAFALDPEAEPVSTLPADHPAWMRDTLSLSQRARGLIVRMKPVVLRVIAFWEHRVRSIVVGGRTLCVDASGSYRVE